MQILLIRNTNGCHNRRYGQINHIKISKLPMLWQKKNLGLCNFFLGGGGGGGLLNFVCLIPALWACDEKNFLRRLVEYTLVSLNYLPRVILHVNEVKVFIDY